MCYISLLRLTIAKIIIQDVIATNTDVSLYFNHSAILAEHKTLQNRASEIGIRLMKTENETVRALQLLEEHKTCM